jgi:hypothetical protein
MRAPEPFDSDARIEVLLPAQEKRQQPDGLRQMPTIPVPFLLNPKYWPRLFGTGVALLVMVVCAGFVEIWRKPFPKTLVGLLTLALTFGDELPLGFGENKLCNKPPSALAVPPPMPTVATAAAVAAKPVKPATFLTRLPPGCPSSSRRCFPS